jgi:putative copper export protein
MLSPTTETIRLVLHVLAASIWVGGQVTLAGLVPGLRDVDAELPRRMARRFNRIAWPAFGALVVTGVWNLLAEKVTDKSTAYQVTLFVKLLVVAVSGLAAWIHSNTKNRLALAVGGALGGLGALGALFLGVLLSTAK